jgi:uncharacterized protein (DUF2235 family)
MSRRLIVLCDGTWDSANTRTNVERFQDMIAATDRAGRQQLCRYIAGVGIKTGLLHWLGGAFGVGLSRNVKQGYRWLSQNWCVGDEIWLLGFSRGAYTARSIGGLIRKCGLLTPDDRGQVGSAAVRAAYKLYRNALHPDHAAVHAFRAAHSREVTIRFIGVWDTVGALGIPCTLSWLPFARSRYGFHDVTLSRIVQYAYQALALDEHRVDFKPAKWQRLAGSLAPGEAAGAWKPGQIEVEQRWFVGAHADVGGGEKADGAGHRPDTLPEITLAWMQAKAKGAGMAFTADYTPVTGAELDVPNHSYDTFLGGLYRHLRKKYNRVLGGGIHETIDPSVWLKWHQQSCYRPATLQMALDEGLIALGSVEVQ